ncbi:hypothetical protein AL08_11335 [Corynebacterium diphtheriae bv. gravis str. ISS 4746]|nr:hypothetical protein B179_11244 [Corynebacterium diphtheriae str. Aberdeen]KLN37301.1 hypothetical protein AL08_11335 [Corynebacterium diphtheriae bv. gravis str. ISS 4746]KLN45461.1 hypothetical protein AL09_00205 [Corynebacterium diphtheriae bv. gravis str. ISS 4749]
MGFRVDFLPGVLLRGSSGLLIFDLGSSFETLVVDLGS